MNHRLANKEKWISDHVEEWYLYSLILLGNQTDAKKLVEETVHRVKNTVLFSSATSSFKPFVKAYKKYNSTIQNNFFIHEKTPLLNNLLKVKKEYRIILVLTYINKLSTYEIKKLTKLSIRKINEVIYHSIPIWTNKEKLAKLSELETVVAYELSMLSEEHAFKPNTQKVVTNFKKEKKEARKRRIIFSVAIILLFVVGGSINKETIQATRLGSAPDIYAIYKNGGVFQLQEELFKTGYTNFYIEPYFESGRMVLNIDSEETMEQSEEISDFAKEYFEERNLDYTIQIVQIPSDSYEYVEAEEVELTEEEEAWEKENRMMNDISDLINSMTSFDGVSWDENKMFFTIIDNITPENEAQLKSGIQRIMQEYGLLREFTFEKIPAKKIELQTAFMKLAPSITEAFYREGKFEFQYIDAYYENEKLLISIYTSLYMPENEEKKEVQQKVKDLKRALTFFLSHKDISEIIQKVPYEIKVYDQIGYELESKE